MNVTNLCYGQQAQEKIADLIAQQKLSPKELQQAYTFLSHRYHKPKYKPGFINSIETIAYAAARLPATYAAVSRTLEELPDDFQPESLLDFGCGPGTAALACLDHFSTLSNLVLTDQNEEILKLAKTIVPNKSTISLTPERELENSYDLIVLSYMMNELSSQQQQILLEKIIAAAKGFIIITVPGTPKCYSDLMVLRDLAISLNVAIYAPCPHQQTCPLNKTNDWCHFSTRLTRTKLHQKLKDASLNYEDEKFSYLILSKFAPSLNSPRIIKKPQHRSGHSSFEICYDGKIEKLTLSRKDKELFHKAKKYAWGDKF